MQLFKNGLQLNKTNLLLVGYLRNQPAEPKRKEGQKMQTKKDMQLMLLVNLIKTKWEDNSVEAVVGMLSTITTEEQIQTLIDSLIEYKGKEGQ